MSVRDIIQHSLEKNPLAIKEALEAEMQERVRLAIEEKMAAALEEDAEEDLEEAKDEDEDEDDEDEDEDEDDLDEEVEQLDELSPEILKRYMHKSSGMDDRKDKNVASVNRLRAQGKAHRVLGNDKEADRLRDKAKKRDDSFAKAQARHYAATGFKKKGQPPAVKGSPVDKATQKMPSSYYKEEHE